MLKKARLKSKSHRDSEGEPLYWNIHYGWCLIGGATIFAIDDKENLLHSVHREFKDELPMPSPLAYTVTVIPD